MVLYFLLILTEKNFSSTISKNSKHSRNTTVLRNFSTEKLTIFVLLSKKEKFENFVPIKAKPPVTKSQDTTTAEWLALVQLQQQLLLQQQSYAMQQHPQMASNSLRATSILYPTTPGAISVGKFPNPQTVNRLLGQ